MLAQIFTVLAPVFALTAVGVLWARAGAPFDVAFVTRLAMNVSGPCLIFATLVTVEIDQAAFETLALATLTLYGLVALATAAMIRLAHLDARAFLSPMIFGNTGNLGLPIALYAYGPEGLALAIVIFAVMAALNFTFGVWLVSGDASPVRALQHPLFIGSGLGVIWVYFDIPMPAAALETLKLAGQIMIPTMLITLGVSIAQLKVTGMARMAALSGLKLAIGLTVGLLVVELFELTDAARGSLLLQAVMPVAVTSYLLAASYDAEPDQVAALAVVSTVLSAVALPALLAVLLSG